MALLYLQTRPDFLSHGRVQTGSSRRRQALPAAGDILRYARRRTDTNEAHLLDQEVQERSSRQDSGQALLDDTDSRSLDPLRTSTTAMSDARHTDTSPRGCPQCTGLSGPMHPVSDSRPARSDTSPDPSGTGLEGTDDHRGPSSCGLDASSAGGTDSEIQRILYQALGRNLPQTELANEDHTRGWHHSLSAMESSTEMPPAGSDSGDCHRRDGAEDPAPPYGIDGTGQLGSILCTQESGQHHGGHPMEDSASYEERPTHVRDALADRLSSLDVGGGPSEGSLTAEISGCARDPGDCIPPPIREPPSLKELLCGALLGAQLQNDSCWCWANAGLLSTLWALLCRQTFSLGDFGAQIRSIRAFLHQLRTTPRQKVVQCFPDLFQQATQQCVPRDAGEFVSELLLWLETEAISMTWERRYTADSKVVRTEAGSWQFPIALDCLFELDIPSPSLEQLLQPWIYADSMKSAFLSVGTLKCIHVDRVILPANGLGHNHPIALEDEVLLPFFKDDHSIDIHWVKHMPVAGIVHLGSMRSGHFITFLHAQNPSCWYELDDLKPAKRHDRLPRWALERLVLIWLAPSPCNLDTTYPTLQELTTPLSGADTGALAMSTSGAQESSEGSCLGDTGALDTSDEDMSSLDDQQRLTSLLSRITMALDPPAATSADADGARQPCRF